jgi:hypothetical protein
LGDFSTSDGALWRMISRVVLSGSWVVRNANQLCGSACGFFGGPFDATIESDDMVSWFS